MYVCIYVCLAQLAVLSSNRTMARFIFDMMLFRALPYGFPIAVSAALFCGAFVLLGLFGWFYGGISSPLTHTYCTYIHLIHKYIQTYIHSTGIYWFLLNFFSSWTFSQYMIEDHRNRIHIVRTFMHTYI
jgi:hypothetical protein